MSSKVVRGEGFIRVGNGDIRQAGNFDCGSKILDGYVNNFLTGWDAVNPYACLTSTFRRHSGLRYNKAGRVPQLPNYDQIYGSTFAGYWNLTAQGAGMGVENFAALRRRTILSATSPYIPNLAASVDDSPREMAVGALAAGWRVSETYLTQDTPFPSGYYGRFVPLSWIDIPGNTIGNHFRHGANVPNGQWFFVSSGDVITSQGTVTLGGRFNPPEHLLNHYMYQIYYTKSGGTGQPILASYTNTGSINTVGGEFQDSGYSFVAGDVGKMVKITDSVSGNNRTYRIAAVAASKATLADGHAEFLAGPGGTVKAWARGNHNFGTSGTFTVIIAGTSSYDGTYTATIVDERCFTFGTYTTDQTGTFLKQVTVESSLTWEMRLGDSSVTTGESGKFGTGKWTAPDTFEDYVYTFVSGDVGKYVVGFGGTSSRNTFLIKGVSGGKAILDAADINVTIISTDFGNVWELRTGPIAEYFWRRRPYNKYDRPYSGLAYSYSSLPMSYVSNEMQARAANAVPIKTLYDGMCNWWTLAAFRDATNLDNMSLTRWTHMSPFGVDPLYKDGDITGMPTGIEYWSDMDVDRDGFMWIAWRQADKSPDSPNQNKTMACIELAPGGDALNPDCPADLYEAQSSQSDATNPLCSNRPIAVLFDDIAERLWIFHGQGTRLGTSQDNGGITYRTYGDSWCRLHRLHSKTGTVTTVNGSTTIEGSGTSFTTEFAVGDWIRIGSDTRSYRISTITDNDTLDLSETYQGTGTSGLSIQKGVLSASQAIIYYNFTSVITERVTDEMCRGPCDFDKSGNVYWIPSGRDRICKFVLSEGTVYEVLLADLPSDGEAFIANLKHLNVSRLPNLSVHAPHELDNDIWVGSFNKGMARIPNKNFENLSDTGSISSVATLTSAISCTDGYGKVLVTWTAHGLKDGDSVVITGTTDYNGTWTISNVTTNTFTIADTYVSDQAGTGQSRVRMTTSAAHGILRVGARVRITNTTNYNGFYEIKALGSNTFDIVHVYTAETFTTATWKIYGTRYHWSLTTSWPLTIDLADAALVHYNMSALVDQTSGQIWLVCNHSGGAEYQLYPIPMNEPDLSAGTWQTPVSFHNVNGTPASQAVFQMTNSFGRFGTSAGVMSNCGPADASSTSIGLLLHQGPWTSYGWNGTSWEPAQFNAMGVDLDFDASAGGPYVSLPKAMRPGYGVRRAHENAEYLADPTDDTKVDRQLTLKFNQLGTVAQANEFKADETTCIPCWVGWGKDNLSDLQFAVMHYRSPTVYREGDDEVKPAANIWTSEPGVDGGFSTSNSPSNLPEFSRGIAEPDVYCATVGTAPYPNMYDSSYANTSTYPDMQYMAALRIVPEGEFAADGTAAPGGVMNRFTSAGAYTFTNPDDVGKSIIIEGSGSGNNGQKVITSVISGSTVEVDSNFAATEASLRWKLVDIPAVGYVEVNYYRHNGNWPSVAMNLDLKLYSSKDRGVTWDLVKNLLKMTGATKNQAISAFEDDGVVVSTCDTFGNNGNTHDPNFYYRVTYDLTALPATSRRRTYWKVWRHAYNGWSGHSFSSIVLYDDSHCILGATDRKLFDADNAKFCAAQIKTARMVLGNASYSVKSASGGTITTYLRTNRLELNSGSFYDDSGTDGDTTGGSATFSAASAAFVPTDVGKQLYIPGGALSGAGTYTKFVTITAVTSATQVSISSDLVDATGLTWALLSFGYGDEVYFDDDAFLTQEFISARALRPRILDVPDSTHILLTRAVVPYGEGAPFGTAIDCQIVRAFPNGVTSAQPGWGGLDVTNTYYFFYTLRHGVTFMSDPLEFILLHAAVGSCTTPADDDGDSRTEYIDVPHDLTSGFDAVAPGDFVLVTGTGVGRRVLRILSATWSSPNTRLKVNLDELKVSLTGLSCAIYRRRQWIKTRVLETVTVAKETI